MLVKPWNYHFFDARALDAFSNLPSLPSFLLLETRRNLYSSSSFSPIDESNSRKNTREREERVGSMYFRNVERSSTLGEGRGLIHHHLESLTSGEGGRKSQSHDTRVELSSRSAEKIGGERMVVGGLLNVTSTLASSRLHFSSRLCYEANYAWPQISSSEKLAKLNVANVRKIDLSPLSLYVSFVIFQHVAISTDFSFS